MSISQPTPLPVPSPTSFIFYLFFCLPSPGSMVHGGKDVYLFCSAGAYPGPRTVLACSEYQRLCSEWTRKWMTAGISDQSISQFSCSVMSNSSWPYGRQHARPPCTSPTPGACSNSCPSSRWCHPTISSSVIPFSSCLQSFPALGSFPMSQFFASGGQNKWLCKSIILWTMHAWMLK